LRLLKNGLITFPKSTTLKANQALQLQKLFPKKAYFELLYRASRDGYNQTMMGRNADGKGATVMIIKSKGNNATNNTD